MVKIPVKKGDKVKVDYKGTFDDGTVFDASEKAGKPLEFECGCGEVIPGFDDAVIGMEKGDEKEVRLPPGEAYGDPDPNLIKEVPRANLPQDEAVPEVGMKMVIGLPNGMRLSARIVEVTDETIKCDLNHPMAGKTLNFWIRLVDFTST